MFWFRRPDDSVILFVKSRSAMLFHMSCSSFVRIWHQMCIISLTFSSSLRLSWIILATRSLDGKRNFAFAADWAFGVVFAANVGTVNVSESSSVSESDSESLTSKGKSKKEKSFWCSHSSMMGSKHGTWEDVVTCCGPVGVRSQAGVLDEDLLAEDGLDFPSFP